MDKTAEVCEKSETQALMLEDAVSDDQSTQQDELAFPWALVHAVKDLNKIIQSKPKFTKNWLCSFQFQLLIVFCICITCIVVGSIFLRDCYCNRMLSIVFIVEGTCGLFIVIVHTCAIVFEWTPSKVRGLSVGYRLCIRIIIIFAQLLTAFCILWFFIGHIWFIQVWFKPCYYGGCYSGMRTFTIIMVIIHYIVGIWIVFCRVWNTRRVLHGLQKIVQDRLEQFPDYEKHLNTQESTLYLKK